MAGSRKGDGMGGSVRERDVSVPSKIGLLVPPATEGIGSNCRRLSCQVTTFAKLFAYACAFVTKQYASDTGKQVVMSHAQEGNRRSGVADFSGLSTYGFKAYKGTRAPSPLVHWGMALAFYLVECILP